MNWKFVEIIWPENICYLHERNFEAIGKLCYLMKVIETVRMVIFFSFLQKKWYMRRLRE